MPPPTHMVTTAYLALRRRRDPDAEIKAIGFSEPATFRSP
jgi:hypothetical protein